MAASVSAKSYRENRPKDSRYQFLSGAGGRGSLLQLLAVTPKQPDMATGSAAPVGWTFMNELEGLCEATGLSSAFISTPDRVMVFTPKFQFMETGSYYIYFSKVYSISN